MEHTYVIASTLNQMVNLIPMLVEFRHIKMGARIYNITLVDENGDKQSENEKWDKNFKACVDKLFPGQFDIQDIPIGTNLLLNSKELGEEISNQITMESNPLFWNITGGQRHYLFAVNQVISAKKTTENKVFYLDGNNGQIYWMHGQNEQNNYKIQPEQINILLALQLMGFDVANYKYDESDGTSKGLELWKIYTENESLRQALILSNKGEKMEKDLSDVYSLLGELELIEFVKRYERKSYPFGYLLEEMVVDTLKRTFKEDILEIAHSTKLKHESSTGVIDEFDILLLNRSGQIINFECKSGFMDGDVAKSTRYSTYAIGGVYGLPILITPLIKTQIVKFESLPDDVFKSIKASIRAAKRAKLEIWGIDEIVNQTRTKLNSTK